MLSSEEKRYFEVNGEEDYPKTNKYIDDMMSVLGNHEFEFLDLTFSNPCELTIEYVGDDIEYKESDDFNNKFDWYDFSEKQRSIVFNHFIEALNELKDKLECGNIRKIHNDCTDDYVIMIMNIKFLD